MRLILNISLIFFLIVTFFTVSSGVVHAEKHEQLELPKTTVNPGSFYYPFKRLWEKGRDIFNFTTGSKKSYTLTLLKIRLSELNYVVDNKLLSEVQSSSERFAYSAGIVADLIKKSSDDEQKKLIEDFGKYENFLGNLRDKYPANSSFWMLIQHDINSLKILSEKLRQN